MIHMLSRFDLKPGISAEEFKASYALMLDQLRDLDLVETSGPVGERVSDTPMDTDASNAPRFYVLMSFRDRAQLDASYDYLSGGGADREHIRGHLTMHRKTTNQTFTCWSDA